MKTCIREWSNTRTGGTSKVLEVFSKPPAFILWQSPNKNARDKAKEFSARIACLKYKWNQKRKRFEDRGYRIFMIVDGIWSNEDLESLIRFGCENVFYPDEMDQLVKLLKGIEVKKKFDIHVPEEELPLAAEVNAGEFGTKKA